LLVVNNTLLRLTKLRTIELPHFNVKKVLLAILEGSQMKLKPLLCINLKVLKCYKHKLKIG